jgi:hypothetical protein
VSETVPSLSRREPARFAIDSFARAPCPVPFDWRSMLRDRLTTPFILRALAVLPVLAALWMVSGYPLGIWWGLAIFIAPAVLFYLTNDLWIAAVPIALAAGDLYPWTGRLLVTESDWILLAVLAALFWRSDVHSPLFSKRKICWILWLPLAVSAALSFQRGWHSLPASLLVDEFSIYTNHWNALRVAKGFAWGFILAQLLFAALEQRVARFTNYTRGMQASALVVAAIVVLERAMSVSLLDREQLYRASGPFVSMHTGGQHIDAFWAMALPFVFLPLSRKTWLDLPARGCLLVLSFYAIVATMSRGIMVLAGIVTVILNLLALGSSSKGRPRWHAYVIAGATMLLVTAACTAILENQAITQRFTESRRDFASRWQQWQSLCNTAQHGWTAKLIGNGLGTVPSIASLAYHEPLRTSELVALSDGRVALRIRPGKDVYIQQIVDVGAPSPWKIEAHVRTEGRIDLHAYVCRKLLCHSFTCVEGGFSGTGQSAAWQPFAWAIDTKPLLPPESQWKHCPVTLAFSASNDGTFVDITDIELRDADGRSLLENANLEDGSAHWFFTSDDHSAWRAENMWVYLYLELGWFGVASFAWLLIGTLVPLAREVITKRDFTLCVLGVAIVGFVAMGLFGSMLETPWIAELFLSLLGVSQAKSYRAA